MAVQVTSDLQENIRQFEELFSDCADIKKRKIMPKSFVFWQKGEKNEEILFYVRKCNRRASR